MAVAHIRVLAEDGQYIGRLEHIAADQQTGRPTGLVIERNGNQLLVPLRAIQQSDGRTVTLHGTGESYEDLRPFQRGSFRLLDEELEREETRQWMAEMGVDDFQIGGEDEEQLDEKMPDEREAHTGAENPYRSEMQKNGNGSSEYPIADDPTDMNEPNEQMAERTRSDMH
ncbi:MAG: PRC-barrel domain-containing protein [Hyphomicrobiales bacterium]